eukprot:6458667-Amphidinium_carterae.1
MPYRTRTERSSTPANILRILDSTLGPLGSQLPPLNGSPLCSLRGRPNEVQLQPLQHQSEAITCRPQKNQPKAHVRQLLIPALEYMTSLPTMCIVQQPLFPPHSQADSHPASLALPDTHGHPPQAHVWETPPYLPNYANHQMAPEGADHLAHPGALRRVYAVGVAYHKPPLAKSPQRKCAIPYDSDHRAGMNS